MVRINNNSLLILVVGVLLLAVLGTLLSVSFLEDVSKTGYVTNNQTGTVNLTIAASLSVILTNDTIDFGSCSVSSGSVVAFDSALGPTGLNNSLCTGGVFPDNISVQNDGNVNANITVRINTNGSVLFNDANSGLGYRVINDTTRPGCEGPYQTSYLNFTATGAGNDYLACGNLTYDDANDQFLFLAKAWLSPTATGGGTATVTFEAHPIA